MVTFIDSKWTFLLVINVFLLVVGMLMEIFSAVVVVPPLIAPIGAHFGIDPYHLGAIFLLNLESFEKALPTVYKAVLPFILILTSVLMLVSYVPKLSTWSSRLVAPVNLDAEPDRSTGAAAGSAPAPAASAPVSDSAVDAGAAPGEGEEQSGSGETLEDLLREDKPTADAGAAEAPDAGSKSDRPKEGGETLEDLLREAQ
jgi:hypothetical protein